MEDIKDINEKGLIKSLYQKKRLRESLVFLKFGMALYLVVVPFFLYIERTNTGLPVIVFLWRLLPFVPGSLLLMLSYSRFRSNLLLMKILYGITLMTLLMMFVGIFAIVDDLVIYQRYFGGLLLTIFLVFIAHTYGPAFLSIVYAVPLLSALVSIMVLYPGEYQYRLVALVNPARAVVALTVFSWYIYRLRYREFVSREKLALRNQIINDSNIRLKKDMELARVIQERLIPKRMPVLEGVRFSSKYVSLGAVGGDFFDFIEMNDADEIGVLISDVEGHGVSAAFITSILKTVIHTGDCSHFPPVDFLKYLNERIYSLKTGRHFTAFYGIYNRATGVMTYARGGNPYPICVKGSDIIELMGRGHFMGMEEDLHVEEESIQLSPGDRILFYTDGLSDVRNNKGEYFYYHLKDIILPKVSGMNITDLAGYVYEQLAEFTKESEMDDDICIISMDVVR